MAVAQDKRASELTAPVSIADTDVFPGYRPGTGGEPNLDIRASAGLIRAPILAGLAAGNVAVGIGALSGTTDVTPTETTKLLTKDGAALISLLQAKWHGGQTGEIARTIASLLTERVSILAFGGKNDTIKLTDGGMAVGSAILTSAAGLFTSAMVGKNVLVQGGGAASIDLLTTVSSYQSATQITLAGANASGGALSGATIYIGTSSTTAFNNATTYAQSVNSEVYFPPGIYMIGTWNIYTPIRGCTNSEIVLLGTAATFKSSHVSIEDFKIRWSNTTQILNFTASTTRISIRNNTFYGGAVAKTCVYINVASVTDIVIKDNIMVNPIYGVIVNSAGTGTRLRIANNTILGATSDCIEINTTLGTFTSIIIDGNILSCDSTSVNGSSGFCIGVAEGVDVRITDNQILDTRNDAIHIEDACQRVYIAGNTGKSVRKEFIWVAEASAAQISASPAGAALRDLDIIGNAATAFAGNASQGISLVSNADGTVKKSNILGNRMNGFLTGIGLGDGAQANVQGNYLTNCTTGLSGASGAGSNIEGNYIHACANAYLFTKQSGVIGKNYLYNVTSEFLDGTSSDNQSGMSRGRNGYTTFSHTGSGSAEYVVICPLGRRADFQFLVQMDTSANNNDVVNGSWHLTWDGTTLTTIGTAVTYVGGAASAPVVRANAGNLEFGVTFGAARSVRVEYSVDGMRAFLAA